MQSIVINKCFGGFGISEKGVLRYAEIKGIRIYPEPNATYPAILPPTYWLVPAEDRVKELEGGWHSHSLAARSAFNKAYSEQVLNEREIPRDDAALVRVVKELGEKANGSHAELRVVDIPDGVSWEIQEYDGLEHIAQVHETWG